MRKPLTVIATSITVAVWASLRATRGREDTTGSAVPQPTGMAATLVDSDTERKR